MHCAIRLAAGLTLLVLGSGLAGFSIHQHLILDLRNAPSAERQSLGVPGSSVAAVAGSGTRSEFYQLPLRLRINKVSLQENGTRLAVELEFLNTGTSVLRIPSCLDALKAHGPNTVDRRTFGFGVVFHAPRGEIERLMDVTFGSSSQDRCSVLLKPGDSLLVIDEMSMPGEVLTAKGNAVAKAFAEEWKIENGRYHIQSRSQRVESESVKMPL